MGDDDSYVLMLPVPPEVNAQLVVEYEREGFLGGLPYYLGKNEVYFPFWYRGFDTAFWDPLLLGKTNTVARQMQERFDLPGPIAFGVMQSDCVGLHSRFVLGAAYPRPAGGGGLALPVLRDRGLSVERLPPLKFEGEYYGYLYAYKLVARYRDFFLYVGLEDLKNQMVLFRVIQNGTPFSRFQEMAHQLGDCIESLACAATGGFDKAKAWGVFWPVGGLEYDIPSILSDSIRT